jgi:general secretion pathway protein D
MHLQYQRSTRLLALSITFAAIINGGSADLPKTSRASVTNSPGTATNSISSSNRMAELRRRIRQDRLTNGVAIPTNGITNAANGPAVPTGRNATLGTNATLASTNKTTPLALPSPLPLPGTRLTNTTLLAPGTTIPTNRLTALPGGVPGRAGTNRSGLTNLAGPKMQSPAMGPILNSASETNKPPMVGSGADDIIESVDLQLDNMPIAQFLDVYGNLSHRTVIRANTLPAQNLTLTAQTALTRREAIEAMDGVLAQNGITMIPMGEKFVKAVAALTAQQEGAPISEANAKELPDADQFVTRIVKLKAAKALDVAPLFATFSKSPTAVTPIESNNTLILRDYAANVKRMLDIIERVDVTPESDFKLEVVNIKYGKVEDIYATMSALISGGGGAGGAGAIPGAAAAQRQGGFGGNRGGGNFRGGNQGFGGGFGGNSGYGGGYGNNGGFNNIGGNRYGGNMYPQSGEIIKMPPKTDSSMDYYPQQAAARNLGSVAGNAGSFQNRLNNVTRGAAGPQPGPEQVLESANIVPDYRSNRLLIFANKHDMEMITNLVSKVDTLLAQVLIEAIIMEVEIGDSQSVGVTMASSRRIAGGLRGTAVSNPTGGGAFLNAITNLPSGGGKGFNYFGQVGNDLDFVVNAIAETSTTKVVSRPRIQTSHAIPGSFFLGQTVPYVTGATDYGGYGVGLASRSTVSQASVGFSLNVVPFITPEGLVVMDISQTFDTLGRDVIIDSNPIPVINNRTADATLTVRSGDVIMMGGFIHDQRQQSNSGVPFLKDIPGIGALFRSKSHNNDRTELIVLMRATVLDTPEAAAISAATERAALPGIRQAEREFQNEDNKRLKKDAKKNKEN